MRPKYSATDLFRLRKPLKLLSLIDGYDEVYIDVIFERMRVSKHTSRDLTQLLANFKDFFDDKLPGITTKEMKVIEKAYHHKIERRKILKNNLKSLHPNNRLLPLSWTTYEKFGKRSKNHFQAAHLALKSHAMGQYLAKMT